MLFVKQGVYIPVKLPLSFFFFFSFDGSHLKKCRWKQFFGSESRVRAGKATLPCPLLPLQGARPWDGAQDAPQIQGCAMCTLSCPKHPSSGCAGTMCLCSCQSLHLSPRPWQKPLFVTRLIIKILQLINGSAKNSELGVLPIPPLCRQLLNSFIWIMISEGKYNLAIVVKVFRQFSRWKTPREKDSYNKNMKTEGCDKLRL